MNYIKRAFISIKRNFLKAILFLGSIALIGAFLSFGISIQRAISQTELHLRDQVPPVTVLRWEWEILDEFGMEFLNMEMIETLGSLPYIYTYDVSSRSGLLRVDLTPAIPPFELFEVDLENPEVNQEVQLIKDRSTIMFGLDDHVIAIGVNTPSPVDLAFGLIEMIDGHFINEYDIINASEVVVISQAFAEENDLSVGDTLMLEYNVIDHITPLLEETEWELIDPAEPGIYFVPLGDTLYQRVLDLEIIGIFAVDEEIIVDTPAKVISVTQLYNQVYIPHRLREDLYMDSLPYWLELSELHLEVFGWEQFFVPSEEQTMYIEAVFLLRDSREFGDFSIAAQEILPDGWQLEDTSGIFGSLLAAMDSMIWMSSLIFWGSLIATGVISNLMILLFFQDRKHEIGIYLALGEKRWRILIQLIIEVMSATFVGLVLALFLGYVLSQEISTNMMHQQIIQQLEVMEEYVPHVDLHLFAPQPLAMEEMLEMYDVSLDLEGAMIVFIVGGVTVLLSTALALSKILKSSLKDILMKGSIG
ncbi:MAG: ABC transporter permease [Turicibacter sp.]|nr:ABC transporter permease [Turicibacter sp.]